MIPQETKETKADKKTVSELWDDIARLFLTRNALKTRKIWVTGLSARIGKKRLSALRGTKQAKALLDILKDLSQADIKALRTFAAINQEQAISAFKVTMIGNVSVPIGVLAIAHQLSPNGLGQFFLSIFGEANSDLLPLIIATILLVIGTSVIVFYSLANLNQARDIRHLIDLYAAEQGIYFGLEDMDALTLN